MISGNARNLGIIAGSEFLPLLQVVKRLLVVVSLELAEAEKIPRRPVAGIELHNFFESGCCFDEVVCVVLERSQVPPALFPVGADFHCALVVTNRVFDLARFARRGCRFFEVRKGGLDGLLWSGHPGECWRHQESENEWWNKKTSCGPRIQHDPNASIRVGHVFSTTRTPAYRPALCRNADTELNITLLSAVFLSVVLQEERSRLPLWFATISGETGNESICEDIASSLHSFVRLGIMRRWVTEARFDMQFCSLDVAFSKTFPSSPGLGHL